jgi:hypothetical protein
MELFAILSLAAIGVPAAAAMLWGVRRFSDQGAILRTKRRLRAHLYELRLFADEPGLIWRAQKGLLAQNTKYLGLMLRPALVLALPMVLLLAQIELFYGRRPLPVGEPAMVTLQMEHPPVSGAPPSLEVPEGVAVETPPVRVLSERQVSWRIRPLREVSGLLRISLPGGTLDKTVDASSGLRRLSARRVSSLPELLLHPGESPIRQSGVEWIEVAYPSAELRLFGFGFHWLVWFTLFSLAAALLLKKRFRVSL